MSLVRSKWVGGLEILTGVMSEMRRFQPEAGSSSIDKPIVIDDTVRKQLIENGKTK